MSFAKNVSDFVEMESKKRHDVFMEEHLKTVLEKYAEGEERVDLPAPHFLVAEDIANEFKQMEFKKATVSIVWVYDFMENDGTYGGYDKQTKESKEYTKNARLTLLFSYA